MAVAMGVATLVASGVEPAGATTSTVTVDPSTGLRDGDTVSVTVADADFTNHSLLQCSSDWLTDPTRAYPDPWGVLYHCTPEPTAVTFTAEPGTTTTVEVTVQETFTPTFDANNPVHCGLAPDDCMIVDLDHVVGQFPVGAAGYAPISLEGTPTIQLSPLPVTSSPFSLTVTGGPFRQEPVTLAQCSAAWTSAPDAATADASCGAPVTVSPDAAGSIAASLTVTDPLSTRDGGTVACGATDCAVVAGYADEPVRASSGLMFGPPSFTASPTTGLRNGMSIDVEISGVDAPSARVDLCLEVLAGGPIPEGRFCLPGYEKTVTLTNGAGEIDFPAGTGFWYMDYDGPLFVQCITQCYLAASTSSGEQIADTIPVAYAPPPTASLGSSADNWDEGTVATLHAENLPLDEPLWRVTVCNAGGTSCEPSTLVTNHGGTIDVPVTLTQAPGDTRLCSYCMVRLDSPGIPPIVLAAHYQAPDDAVTLSASTDLTDGQEVTVTGTGILGNYEGRTLFLPTGGWSPVVVCDQSVVPQTATLLDLLTKCAVPAGDTTVTPVDHGTSNTVSAPAQFTATLGGATFDCTAAPGACTMGLVRWEQNARVTALLEPLTFATG